MKRLVWRVVLAGFLGWSATASAQGETVCLSASEQGQTARDAHRLLEARNLFRMCARASCPTVVQRDCAMWLDDVERALPTVVLSVRDAQGRDVPNVHVSEDGYLLPAALNGTAIAMNPGPHTFRFELANGTSIEVRVVVPEGQKAFPITANTVAVASPPIPPSMPAATTPAPSRAPIESPAPSASNHTLAYVVLGVGGTGILVGSIFGILALNKKSSLDNDCSNHVCPPNSQSDIDTMHTHAIVSTAGFVIGALGAGIGGGLLLFGSSNSKSGKGVKPSIGLNSVGLTGSF